MKKTSKQLEAEIAALQRELEEAKIREALSVGDLVVIEDCPAILTAVDGERFYYEKVGFKAHMHDGHSGWAHAANIAAARLGRASELLLCPSGLLQLANEFSGRAS